MTTSALGSLEDRFARISRIQDAAAVLQWDMAAMMPAGGAEARGEQLGTLRVLAHDLLADPSVADALAEARHALDRDGAGIPDDRPGGLAWRRANLAEMERRHLRAAAVPGALVARLSEAGARCEIAWREAKARSDYAMIRPQLETILSLVREEAAALGAALGLDPYDALLDGYEPGARAQDIDRIFADLAAFLPDFIDKALARQARGPALLPLDGPFPVAAQRLLCRRFMEALGFDFRHGRLDESHHPFCGGVPEDVRITTRYSETSFLPGMMGVLHETGHALYDQGLPRAWRHQPVGEARGMAMHESQSLLVEMQICRSRAFLEFAAPLIREAFGREGPAFEAENLYRHATRVRRDFIRVDADEATYPAHVILRYRLERAMIAGDLALVDLPQAWNDGLRGLLGIVPPDDARGCLQDIHWYDGAWGYFPTYTLGAMAAAQLHGAARAACPDLAERLALGDVSPLLAWLKDRVHGLGSSLSTQEMMREATGQPLTAEAFKAHLTARYLE